MADLRVDYQTLEKLRADLNGVVTRLKEIRADSGMTERAWGGYVVARSMGDFVGNWGIHREKLTEAVQDLAEDCEGVCKTFQSLETALNRAVAGGRGPGQAP